MSRPLELQAVSGPLAGQRVSIPDAGLKFGRSSSNDLHVADGELSRTHCLFERTPEGRLQVIDLASANGTFVNGRQLGADPFELKAGDKVEAGATEFNVVDPESAPAETASTKLSAPAGGVDLGFEAPRVEDSAGGQTHRRSALINILWAVAALSVAGAMGLILFLPSGSADRQTPVAREEQREAQTITDLFYEKVDADSSRIFRYQMTMDAEGNLRVAYDDVPGENRHVDKTAKLPEPARRRIAEIFASQGWRDLEGEYVGYAAEDGNALKSRRIRVVVGTSVKQVLVENTAEPEQFASIVSSLEAFSRNELGIWALQYSREQLVQLSSDMERVGDSKWDERDVEYGNLSASVKAYKEALFYLETVNPKPDGFMLLREKLKKSEAELDRRYKDQRFLADKAINLANWEVARTELRTLCDMVPDKDDERHVEARAKLIDVEGRIASAKKGGKK